PRRPRSALIRFGRISSTAVRHMTPVPRSHRKQIPAVDGGYAYGMSGHITVRDHDHVQREVAVVAEPVLVPHDVLRAGLDVTGPVLRAGHDAILPWFHPVPRHLETYPHERFGSAEQRRLPPGYLGDPSSRRDQLLHRYVDPLDLAGPRPGPP